MSVLRVACPHCGVRLKGDSRLIGRTMACPQCKKPFRIEAPPPAPPATPGSAAAPLRPSTKSEGANVGEDTIAMMLGTHRPKDEPPSGVESPSGPPFSSPSFPSPSAPSMGADGVARIPLEDFPKATATGVNGESLIRVSNDMEIQPVRLDPACRYLIMSLGGMIVAKWENPNTGWQLNTGGSWTLFGGNAAQLPRDGDFRFVTLGTMLVEGETRFISIRTQKLPPVRPLDSLVQSSGAITQVTLGDIGLLREQKNSLYRYLQEHFMPEVLAHADELLDYLSGFDVTTSFISTVKSQNELPPR